MNDDYSLKKIYEEFEVGSDEFVRAVQERCPGLQLSDEEIKRIASKAPTHDRFVGIRIHPTWWTDEANAERD